jgi:hypothetical protein
MRRKLIAVASAAMLAPTALAEKPRLTMAGGVLCCSWRSCSRSSRCQRLLLPSLLVRFGYHPPCAKQHRSEAPTRFGWRGVRCVRWRRKEKHRQKKCGPGPWARQGSGSIR